MIGSRVKRIDAEREPGRSDPRPAQVVPGPGAPAGASVGMRRTGEAQAEERDMRVRRPDAEGARPEAQAMRPDPRAGWPDVQTMPPDARAGRAEARAGRAEAEGAAAMGGAADGAFGPSCARDSAISLSPAPVDMATVDVAAADPAPAPQPPTPRRRRLRVLPGGRRGAAAGRSFVFLQAPHGPFMAELAAALRARGGKVARIAFNGGDAGGWTPEDRGGPGPLLRFQAPFAAFEARLAAFLDARGATDIVLYGDTRPFHAVARRMGAARGMRVHCFEEGYLRPRWITYERGGVNGNSALLGIPVDRMAAAVARLGPPQEPPGREGWGAAHAHALHGVRYHARARLSSPAWPDRAPHMPLAGWREARAYLRRGAALPLLTLRSRRQLAALLAPGAPRFHLALLQLGADSSLRAHSRFADVATVVERMVTAYAAAHRAGGPAAGAPLVFKAHPFEDGRERLARVAARAARAHGVAGRVHFVERGPLGPMLDRALSAATVNSTAAQGALARGLPVLALGESIYARPGLVSAQSAEAFFADPAPPDAEACAALRRFLLLTSQLEGDYYTAAGRAQAMGPVIDAMLRDADPYAAALDAAGLGAGRGGGVAGPDRA